MAEAVVFVAFMVTLAYWEHRRAPACGWCRWRHFGRCRYNPRAGRIFANTDDGYFDVNDPNR